MIIEDYIINYSNNINSEYYKLFCSILNNLTFIVRMSKIGGQDKYHREGSVLSHSILVAQEAAKIWGTGTLMHLVALVHDVGKITHSYKDEKTGDWKYPDHAEGGAHYELEWFIPRDHPDFPLIQWYIMNHMRPLFWRDKTLTRKDAIKNLKGTLPITDDMFDNLCKLTICDLTGSIAKDPNDIEKTITYLKILIEERTKWNWPRPDIIH